MKNFYKVSNTIENGPIMDRKRTVVGSMPGGANLNILANLLHHNAMNRVGIIGLQHE